MPVFFGMLLSHPMHLLVAAMLLINMPPLLLLFLTSVLYVHIRLERHCERQPHSTTSNAAEATADEEQHGRSIYLSN